MTYGYSVDRRKRRPAELPLPNILPNMGPIARALVFYDLTELSTIRPAGDWEEELPVLVREKLAGVGLRAIREQTAPVAVGIVDQLRAHHFRDICHTAQVVQQSASGLARLCEAGIPFIVMKGPGIATSLGAVGERTYADLDLLVPSEQFDAAFECLRALGYAESSSSVPQRRYFYRYCREATNLRSREGGSIDLHHRVSPWNWSEGLCFEALQERAQVITAFGVEMPVLPLLYNTLVAALHVVSDKSQPGRTYRAWRDLALLVNRCDPAALAHAAAEANLCSWLAWLCLCFPEEARPHSLIDGLRGTRDLRSSWRLRKLLTSSVSQETVLMRFFRLPLSNALANAAGSMWPGEEYLQARRFNYRCARLHWIGRAVQERMGGRR